MVWTLARWETEEDRYQVLAGWLVYLLAFQADERPCIRSKIRVRRTIEVLIGSRHMHGALLHRNMITHGYRACTCTYMHRH